MTMVYFPICSYPWCCFCVPDYKLSHLINRESTTTTTTPSKKKIKNDRASLYSWLWSWWWWWWWSWSCIWWSEEAIWGVGRMEILTVTEGISSNRGEIRFRICRWIKIFLELSFIENSLVKKKIQMVVLCRFFSKVVYKFCTFSILRKFFWIMQIF